MLPLGKVTRRAKFNWWDSLMVAAALRADCRVFINEDLNDGQVIDGMRVANPFTKAFTKLVRRG
jgi:predicted nucleic acid-binding protein